MKSISFLFICIFVAFNANASDSLYNSNSARRPPAGLLSVFGPKADGLKYDKRMVKAAEIAQSRARAHSTRRCWRYVKNALLAADVVDSRPTTAYAKQAGVELERQFGFEKISVRDPYKAPLGSVLVYGGRGAGHVEIRTKNGFVSDFESSKPSPRPLIGIYVKPF